MSDLYPLQQQGYFSNLQWLYDHDIDAQRFLDSYWMPDDHPFWWDWFLENPYYAKVIIQDFLKDNDDKVEQVLNKFKAGKSLIVFVLGKRGSGKTGTIFWLAEQVRHQRKVYCVMMKGERKKSYPYWVIQIDDISDAHNGGFVFYDEGVLQVNARESGTKANIWFGKELAIARHKNLTIVIGLQNTKMGDINVFRMADCSFIKPNNAFLKTDERTFQHSELIKFMQPHLPDYTLFVMDKVYIKFKQPLPLCWSDTISKAHSSLDLKGYKEDETVKDKSNGQEKQLVTNRKATKHCKSDKSLAYL